MSRYNASYPGAALLMAALLMAALTSVACGGKKAADTAPPPVSKELPPEVAEVADQLAAAAGQAAAESDTSTSGITASGELVSPVQSELVARTPGRVATILADEGQAVRRGEALLRLETQYLVPEAARAEAELNRARAALEEAQSDFQRKEELLQRGSIPQALYDTSKSAYDQAFAAVAAADAASTLAHQRLQDAVLVSPIHGVVASRKVDVGERLDDGSVAFVIVQVAPLRLRFELPERYLPAVAMGQQVTAEVDPYPGETFTGRIVMVGQVVDSQSRAFRVEAELPNTDGRLRPGLFARVKVQPAAAGKEQPSA